MLEGTEFPRDALERAGFEIKTVSIKCGEYPFNACLNAAVIGKVAIHNLKITAPGLKMNSAGGHCACGRKARLLRVRRRGCRRGLDYNPDEGISRAALSLGLDVLKITPGYIELPGYEYGFIGGCCGKISKNELAFTGKLDGHPDREKILAFLAEKRISPVFLTDGPLFDAGGIIPLCEV